jgi:phosphoenolpyruvate-protein kinase (PTS system EI component)
VARLGLPDPSEHPPSGPPDEEVALLHAAIGRVRSDLAALRTATRGDTQNGILSAHLALVDDVDVRAQTEARIRGGESAAKAVASVTRGFADR